jgi:hypothetical protein
VSWPMSPYGAQLGKEATGRTSSLGIWLAWSRLQAVGRREPRSVPHTGLPAWKPHCFSISWCTHPTSFLPCCTHLALALALALAPAGLSPMKLFSWLLPCHKWCLLFGIWTGLPQGFSHPAEILLSHGKSPFPPDRLSFTS